MGAEPPGGASDPDLERLRSLAHEVRHLEHAATLLSWDQETAMPPGGVRGRGGSLGFLRAEIHRRWASAELDRLVERLTGRLEPGSLDDSLVALCRRQHALAVKLPSSLVSDRARISSQARPVWRRARADSDWSLFAPVMQRVLEVNLETAAAIGYDDCPYDAMLELNEPGLTTRMLAGLLGELRDTALPLLQSFEGSIAEPIDALRTQPWDGRSQLEFASFVAEAIGFDRDQGRIGVSAYPIANAIGRGDVRIATNIHEDRPLRGLFGALHETGHGLYAQGIPEELEATPLWGHASTGVDESQSRLWENAVGHSRPFWEHFLPHLKRRLPGLRDEVDLDLFYASVNRPSSTPFLLDADELSYNIHVLVRFEVENDLLDGRLGVDDVPEAWAERMRRYLGVEVADAAQGPLQDIHWAGCYLGSFTSYTVGDLLAAQMMERVREAVPDLDGAMAGGDFSGLLAWLHDNVHVHGAALSRDELVLQATGAELSAAAWSAYAERKFAPLARGSDL